MPLTAPNTWGLLQGVQARLQSQLLVTDSLVTNASPFTTLSAADQAIYGTTNCLIIGRPKNLKSTQYPRQCHIIPGIEENVYRRAFGGKVWDEQWLYVRFLYDETGAWYNAQQDLIAARDKLQVIMGEFAELPAEATVEAAKAAASGKNVPLGQHYEEGDQGRTFICWGFLWWYRQQFYVPGGIVP